MELRAARSLRSTKVKSRPSDEAGDEAQRVDSPEDAVGVGAEFPAARPRTAAEHRAPATQTLWRAAASSMPDTGVEPTCAWIQTAAPWPPSWAPPQTDNEVARL